MPNYIHRTTLQYLQSIAPADLPEPVSNYIQDPALPATSRIYWKVVGDLVQEMTQVEKNAVDAQILSDARDSEIEGTVDDLESVLRQIVIMVISELNILRQQFNTTTAESSQLTNTALADRTLAQVRTQLRNNLGL